MLKDHYRCCKDDLSKTYADLISVTIQAVVSGKVQESTACSIESDFPAFFKEEVIEKRQKLVEFYQRVLKGELDEIGLIMEWREVRDNP